MTHPISQSLLPRVELKVHFRNGHHGQRLIKRGENQKQATGKQEDLPRLTRLLALAHRWNHLIEEGVIANYSEIARMMGLSRARVTQIMDLLYLAPEIQDRILLRREDKSGMVSERTLRSITRLPIWKEQSKMLMRTIGDDY